MTSALSPGRVICRSIPRAAEYLQIYTTALPAGIFVSSHENISGLPGALSARSYHHRRAAVAPRAGGERAHRAPRAPEPRAPELREAEFGARGDGACAGCGGCALPPAARCDGVRGGLTRNTILALLYLLSYPVICFSVFFNHPQGEGKHALLFRNRKIITG